jgi:hypothetical protein
MRHMEFRPKGKKCLIPGCPNHSSEGRFVGELCSSCHHSIVDGKLDSPWVKECVKVAKLVDYYRKERISV